MVAKLTLAFVWLALASPRPASGQAERCLVLPSAPTNAVDGFLRVTYGNPDGAGVAPERSLFTVDVQPVPAPAIAPGRYAAWCFDVTTLLEPTATGSLYGGVLYSTCADPAGFNPLLPDHPKVKLDAAVWQRINYLINHRTAPCAGVVPTMWEVQRAVYLLCGQTPVLSPPYPPFRANVVQCLVSAATANAAAWQPACGDKVAVIFNIDVNWDLLRPDVQLIFLEVPNYFPAQCPADVIAAEAPAGSGSAVVTFPAPSAVENCGGPRPAVCVPPSGATFAVGTTLVNCTSQDAAGVTSVCGFSVRVIPRRLFVTSTGDAGPGTFRQALLDANAGPGLNEIYFTLPGPGLPVIRVRTPLPAITDRTTIDGTTQAGFAGVPVVLIEGAPESFGPASGGMDGLVITGGNTTVRGLALRGFATGLRIEGPGGNTIQGNIIGTGLIGGSEAGNVGDGIYVNSPGNLIGGTTNGAANVVSGNGGHGLQITTAARQNVVQGNFIGTASNGESPLPNGGHGVFFNNGAAQNLVGGTVPGAGNTIAFNSQAGVAFSPTASTGNALQGNVIFGNGGSGGGWLNIDLGLDGATANDPGDADEGPNDFQNAPVLGPTAWADGFATVQGTFQGQPLMSLRLEFFLNQLEGVFQIYLGTLTVTTDETGAASFRAAFPLPDFPAHYITATATDALGNTSEYSAASAIGQPPFIITQPAGTNVMEGTSVMFCVTAGGTEPLTYQWRRNGANIADATNACYTLPEVSLNDGGTYSVNVASDFGAVESEGALLRVLLPPGNLPIQPGDNYVDSVRLFRTNGVTSGTNTLATFESGEPLHAGKQGGKSVWYVWRAPATGVATFRTVGSTFDTLLGVYVGNSVSNLVAAGSDEDRGGFFTSGTRFNTLAGTDYFIAIDGFGGESGDFVFSWSLQPTNRLLPVILAQPVSQTVGPGGMAIFTVDAVGGSCYLGLRDCRYEPPTYYQWCRNGVTIPGATNRTLVVPNVQEDVLGDYTVKITSGPQTVESAAASLQINLTGQEVQFVQAQDKFLDAANAPVHLRIGGSVLVGNGGFAPASIVRGYTGTQVFNTTTATTSGGEHPICDVMGGASVWISFIAEEAGTLFLNTDGSSYDTVMAVFQRTPTNALVQIACDNNSGLDNKDSALAAPVEAGKTNFVVVDGVRSAKGTLKLNYSLVTTGRVASLGFTVQNAHQVRFTGRPSARFSLQSSSNLLNWATMITANASATTGRYDYTDQASTNATRRFYRALLLP